MSRFDGFAQYIEDAMASWSCPGAVVAIVKGDQVIYESAHGLRDVENQLPMTADTRFAMASVTKSFTAMSAALLVDQGLLGWDKPVREYIPEFILDDPYVTEHVAVRDMLSHRTGLPRHDMAAWRLNLSRAEFIKRMKHFKFSASFREKFQYNNLMYYATAYLVERIAGQRWEGFVQERIFAPLGMHASNFSPEPPQPGQAGAIGYRADRDADGGAKGLIPMPFGEHTELSPGAAGALFSTTTDLIQWLKVHVNAGRAGDVQLISEGNLKQMHLPQMIIPGGGVTEALLGNTIFTYGMGWFIEPYRGHTLVHHGGNVEGHSLIIGFVPDQQIGIVALTNIAMLPLRDVLLYELIDRALDLPDRGWNAKFHAMFDPMIAGEAQGKQTAAAERIENAPPTHPLESYAGTFHADGYPDFAVKLEGEKLQARTVGSLDWSDLRHYHYNVFEWHLDVFDMRIKIRYLVNDSGEIETVAIPIEPTVEDVIFTRTFPALTEEVQQALRGTYQTAVEGLALTISVHGDKVYAAATGAAPEEIKLYRYDAEIIGFRMKRARLDFVRQNNAIARLIFKAPDLTLEAQKQ